MYIWRRNAIAAFLWLTTSRGGLHLSPMAHRNVTSRVHSVINVIIIIINCSDLSSYVLARSPFHSHNISIYTLYLSLILFHFLPVTFYSFTSIALLLTWNIPRQAHLYSLVEISKRKIPERHHENICSCRMSLESLLNPGLRHIYYIC